MAALKHALLVQGSTLTLVSGLQINVQTTKAPTNLLHNPRRMKLAAFAGSQKQQEDITRLGTSAFALPATSGLSRLQLG